MTRKARSESQSVSSTQTFDPASEPLLQGLNDSQREAVTHIDGPMLVLAGPGSGKTRVVTHRVAWLLQNGVKDYNIAALTFTNKAADEMKTRLQALAPGSKVWIGTFHRFCAYLLRYYATYVGLQENYAIYDSDESKKLLEEVVSKDSLPNGVDIQKIASAISWAKNGLVSADDYCAKEGSMLGKIVEEAYPAYQRALKQANAVDFDDLLFHVATLLKTQPEIRKNLDYRFKYILVDEYQDTNLVQYAIARALSIDYPNLAVTGDPDQSIYGWRGANINNILNFEQDFEGAKVVRLEQNYRSAKSILRLADHLIKHNLYRKDKNLYTDNAEGDLPRIVINFDQDEEAEMIAAEIAAEIAAGKRRPRDYAIFYRMNALSRNLEYALRRYGVPFQLVRGLEFFNRKEIKDVCSYLQLAYNPNDVISFKRVVNLPSRGIGRITLEKLEQYATFRGISLFESARNANEVAGISPRVRRAVASFVELIDKLRASFDAGDDLEVALGVLLKETQYVEYLRETAKTEEDEQRLANIQELLSAAREFDSDFAQIASEDSPLAREGTAAPKRDKLGAFLEQIALVNDVDAWESNDDRVSLMTLHAAKGLEFPVVYLIALEDGVLPHERSSHDKRQLEEERRLLFVGITRAKEELRISRTRYREFRGSYNPSLASRFIFEFHNSDCDQYDSMDDWLSARQDAARETPDENIVVPKFFARKEGLSQRQALWDAEFERGFGAQDSFGVFDGATRDVGRRGRKKADLYVEGVDPDPDDDFSQEIPDDDVFVEMEADLEFDDDQLDLDEFERQVEAQDDVAQYAQVDEYDQSRPFAQPNKRAGRKASSVRKAPSPGALTTGSKLEDELDGTPRRRKGSGGQTLVVNSFVQHRRYGVGVVKKISGPSFNRIAKISFLSGVGDVDLPVDDPELTLVAIGRKDAR